MGIPFTKYQGAGNDFVIINHMEGPVLRDLSVERIAALCDRRFGIGADGLMLLEPDADYDFRMRYFNSDGRASSMCGNGGRCIAAFAHRLGYTGDRITFIAVDGPHQAKIVDENWVQLEMNSVDEIKQVLEGSFVETGSPHYVEWVDRVDSVDVNGRGRKLRHDATFSPDGTNVNFVSGNLEELQIATFERGVEAETLACGTGVTAAAMVAVGRSGETGTFTIPVKVKGGNLEVRLRFDGKTFSDVWLCGPATYVFDGEI